MGFKVEWSRFWIPIRSEALVLEVDVVVGFGSLPWTRKNGVSTVARFGVTL